jgi:hypothetical protein
VVRCARFQVVLVLIAVLEEHPAYEDDDEDENQQRTAESERVP